MRWYRHGTTDTPANAKRPKHIPFADWFWSFFQPNGDCLDWTRMLTDDGYGHVRYMGKMQTTHRVAWTLTNGPIPDGLHVLHTCDRRACGNVDHLFLGTNAENVADAVNKGRQTRLPGEANPSAKLTRLDVLAARAMRAQGMTGQQIGDVLGVSKKTANAILRGSSWAHV
jgi:hypothetical protein